MYKITQGWIENIKIVPSSHYNERPEQTDITLLVIHNISLPPKQYGLSYVERFFTGQLNPDEHPYFAAIADLRVSSHFFIKRTGEIIQFVSCEQRAWHAGVSSFKGQENCNDFSIGIELEGSDDDEFTEVQYKKLVKLTKSLQYHYPIKDIVGHSDIAPERKTDPGLFFNWNLYRQQLKNK